MIHDVWGVAHPDVAPDRVLGSSVHTPHDAPGPPDWASVVGSLGSHGSTRDHHAWLAGGTRRGTGPAGVGHVVGPDRDVHGSTRAPMEHLGPLLLLLGEGAVRVCGSWSQHGCIGRGSPALLVEVVVGGPI